MKTLKINLHSRKIIKWLLVPSIIFCLYSCDEELLDEYPLSSLNADLVLSSPAGFETYAIGLVQRAREELLRDDGTYWKHCTGTDMFNSAGLEYSTYRNWISWMTPVRSEVRRNWTFAYTQIFPQANTIIVYANKPELEDIWASEAEKNAIIAEARFIRGFTYNNMANLYGGVPIVDDLVNSPKFDYVRASREQVYEFAKADLEFASQWLPLTVPASKEGRIVKAAADHILSEVCISLGEYDNAITAASSVINSGLYQLMTTRFGSKQDQPGDPFSDLFQVGNYNRSSGNTESIYVWQIEPFTEGGGGTRNGLSAVRNFAPFLVHIDDPAGYAMVVTDSMGRGVGRSRPSNYSLYTIWQDDWNDMRNSPFNMRREFYYNNPASPYYLQKVGVLATGEDSLRSLFPYSRKVEGDPWEGNNLSGRTTNDWYVIRLAETYLLRAEAYFRNGDAINAALDLNTIRGRANATPVLPGDVTIDYILDERARELMTEEPRRRTLIRMGLLVERVRLYDIVPSSRATVQDYHNLWPIPQTAIDANYGATLEQNPGY